MGLRQKMGLKRNLSPSLF